jgi:hypothetical protein
MLDAAELIKIGEYRIEIRSTIPLYCHGLRILKDLLTLSQINLLEMIGCNIIALVLPKSSSQSFPTGGWTGSQGKTQEFHRQEHQHNGERHRKPLAPPSPPAQRRRFDPKPAPRPEP